MPRKLLLVIHSLAGGGAERVGASMANHWAMQGDHVCLLTLGASSDDRYELHGDVDRVCLDLMRRSSNPLAAARNTWLRLRALRGAIGQAQADWVISFTEKISVLVLLATLGMPVRVVVYEQTDPRRHRIGPIWSLLRRWTYPRCTAAVVQTERVRHYVQQLVGDKPVHVIANLVAPQPGASMLGSQQEPDQPLVIGLGRLSPEKGFDLLIRAFARITESHPRWRLKIYGDGPQRRQLEALVRQLGLSQVELCGWTSEPAAALAGADLFVLPSRLEGFPNALLEAMAAGLAVVSFDCDSGPREIIRHEVDGLLVDAEDVEALASGMDRLMSDRAQRLRFGAAAREVVERFSESKFFDRWETVWKRC